MSVLVLVSDRFENNGYNFNDLSLTTLRNAWCSRDCLTSDFFEYLVKYQDVPGPIAGPPIVADTGRNWVSLSWGKPEHRGAAPVVAYKVEAWLKGGETRWIDLGIAGSNNFDAFNLKPEGEYQFRITSRNRYGWGEPVISDTIVIGKFDELPEFIKTLPGQLKVLDGSEVTLSCEVRGSPKPYVKWFKDGVDLERLNSERYQIINIGEQCQLTIKNLNDDDDGRYMCEATNKIGRVSTFARLFVVNDPKLLKADKNLKLDIQSDSLKAVPPQFTMRLRDRRIQVSYPVRLTCQVTGAPAPIITWSKDHEKLHEDDRHRFWTEDHFQTLEIAKTYLEDSGVYCVTATNEYGSVSCRCNLVVDKGIRAYVAPEFNIPIEPLETVLRIGEELRLSGQVQAYPTVGVMWYRDGVKLRPSRKTIMTISHDGYVELTVAHVTRRDAGLYTCIATNEVGRAESVSKVKIDLNQEPITPPEEPVEEKKIAEPAKDLPYSKEPKFLKKPRSTDAYEGDDVVILCEVIGDPKPDVYWLRDFLKPEYYRDSNRFHRVGDGPEYRLEIPDAKLDFTGTYTVYAKNCYGDAKAIISLQIKVKDTNIKLDVMDKKRISKIQIIPKVVNELKDIRCCDGDSVSLECKFDASPPANVRWEKQGKLVHLGNDFNAEFDGSVARLSIRQVYPEDEGEYTCIAYNDLGKTYTCACLIVDVPEGKENLLSQHLSRPPGFLSGGSTPHSTPRTTPVRSVSPKLRVREIRSEEPRPRLLRATPPKFYAVPHNRVADEGETIRFQCAIAGHPDPWIIWDKDGQVIVPSSRIILKEVDDLRIIEIREVTPQDSGLYRITLENDVGRIEATARLDVVAHRPHPIRGLRARSASPKPTPTYRRCLVGLNSRLGGSARLTCDIRGLPVSGIKWYKQDTPIEPSEKYSMRSDGITATLEIFDVVVDDKAVYKCLTEDDDEILETLIELDVFEEELFDGEPPEILENMPGNKKVLEGSMVKLQLRVKGSKPWDVIWIKDGCILPECDDFKQTVDDFGNICLLIDDCLAQDCGNYRCEVYNTYGEANAKCNLTVYESSLPGPELEFIKTPTPVIATIGGQASFCVRTRTTGRQPVEVQWEVDNVPISDFSKYQVEDCDDVHMLHIKDVSHRDAGTIRCVAALRKPAGPHHEEKSRHSLEDAPTDQFAAAAGFRSNAGRVARISCSTKLTVLSSDVELFERDQLLLLSDSDQASMDASDKRSDIGDEEFYLGGVEEPAIIRRGPQDTTALVGDRVLLKATYIGQPEPNVRWTRAGRLLKNDESTSITSGDGVSCLLLQNITADDSGKYDVAVENAYGADCHYASVAVEGPPDPPSGKPCIEAHTESATVAWSSSPYDGGRIITGYSVEYSLVGSEVWTTVTDDCHSLSYVVRGLQAGGRYVFRVRGKNVHGFSIPSLESDILQLEEHNESSTFEPRIVTVEQGDSFKSRYDVLEELGKGRFGIVYKVIDKITMQKLAAKVIKCRTAKDKEKVQEEIAVMNLLRHQKLLQLAAAFENPREIIMITEYISGGELFERVVADDFTLTEKDCILFMRQICEGVMYMHSQNIVHLDLKPENIMCHTRTSHEVKIIDFGLAQKLKPGTPVRVLFGTPEFIPPEIINYEPIGTESDLWSLGVICYVLLSGLSPFMGDNDAETFANITRAEYDFEDEAFSAVSQDARDFIGALLIKRKEDRLSAEECLKHTWLDPENHIETVVISTDKLKKFIIRRKWQKTGNAIRALGRLATLTASRRNSSSSLSSNSPRPSISGNNASRMSSLNEEEPQPDNHTNNVVENIPSDNNCREIDNSNIHEEINNKINGDIKNIVENKLPDVLKNVYKEIHEKKTVRSRVCSERSDSGISDCSLHNLSSCSCTSTPLLRKKFQINEEPEHIGSASSSDTSEKSTNGADIHEDVFQVDINSNNTAKKLDAQISKIAEKFENLSKVDSVCMKNHKGKKEILDKSSRISYNSSLMSNGSPRTDVTTVSEGEIDTTISKVDLDDNPVHLSKLEVTLTQPALFRKSQTPETISKDKPASPSSNCIKRLSIYSSSSVAKTIEKFSNLENTSKSTSPFSRTPSKSPENLNISFATTISKSVPGTPTPSHKHFPSTPPLTPKIESVTKLYSLSPALRRKVDYLTTDDRSTLTSKSSDVKFTQSKQFGDTERAVRKHENGSDLGEAQKTEKPKSESFRKAAAFWNQPK